jgi:hypothetical protein
MPASFAQQTALNYKRADFVIPDDSFRWENVPGTETACRMAHGTHLRAIWHQSFLDFPGVRLSASRMVRFMACFISSSRSQSTIFASSLCSLRSSEFFGSDSSCSLICLSLRTISSKLARNHSCAAFCSSSTGPSKRTAPVS